MGQKPKNSDFMQKGPPFVQYMCVWLSDGEEFERLTFMMFINQGCNSETKQKKNLQVTGRKVMETPHNHKSNADYDVK